MNSEIETWRSLALRHNHNHRPNRLHHACLQDAAWRPVWITSDATYAKNPFVDCAKGERATKPFGKRHRLKRQDVNRWRRKLARVFLFHRKRLWDFCNPRGADGCCHHRVNRFWTCDCTSSLYSSNLNTSALLWGWKRKRGERILHRQTPNHQC